MGNLLYFYQHLPSHIQPDISIFGLFSISWYSIMYLVAFLVVYFLVIYRINRNEIVDIEIPNDKIQISNKFQNPKTKTKNILLDFLLYAFVGLLIGARLGEVLFYNFSYYMADPIRIISPFDSVTEKFVGIYGMSYHGGLIGVVIAAWIWGKKNKINLWQWANLIAPAVPLGYFFGRIGNFINGELYGRVTSKWWGMYFPNSQCAETHCNASLQLRHPSQLYEAFFEGLILFLILWPLRNRKWVRNHALILYLFGYATARFVIEFWREPDGWIGKYLTIGQFLSLLMIVITGIILMFLKNKKGGIINEE